MDATRPHEKYITVIQHSLLSKPECRTKGVLSREAFLGTAKSEAYIKRIKGQPNEGGESSIVMP